MATIDPHLHGPDRSNSYRPVHFLALWGAVVVGTMVRVRGLTSAGLWTSDAWVALSSHVGLGTAWHMWANAPGFDLFERSWLMLYPGSTWWGQIPPLAMGIAGIPAAFLLMRYFRFAPWISVSAALLISVSPICIVYSTRYKDYSADFLVACALLALAERARRRQDSRSFFGLAALSIAGFAISASVLPVLVGIWAAVALGALAKRERTYQWAVPAGVTAAFVVFIWGTLYRNFSPYLGRYWKGHFLTFGSPLAFLRSASTITTEVFNGLSGVPVASLTWNLVTCAVLTGLLVLGLVRRTALRGPALVLVASYAASAVGAIPLGTGRTDEVLYPALLLLIASGFERMRLLYSRKVEHPAWIRRAIGVAGCGLVALLLLNGIGTNSAYRGADVRALAAKVGRAYRPGDQVVVDAFLRYSWALYEDPHPHIVFGSDWMAGFSVASTQPDVFLVPSFSMEGGTNLADWTADLSPYRRVWFVDAFDPRRMSFYSALHRAGWRPTSVVHAAGCEAILLVRLR